MGEQSYREVLQQYRGRILPDNHPLTIMVGQVMKRLIPQAPIEGADWKVHVIHDDSNMNAFVLPGYDMTLIPNFLATALPAIGCDKLTSCS